MSATMPGRESRDGDLRADLLGLIKQKRPEVETYLRLAASRRRLLINTTIIAGTLAAALTAAPALGGKTFAGWLTSILGLSSPAWQLLCGVASMCSIAAAIATQLLKSHNIEDRINRAQGARAKMQMLEVGIESGLMTPTEAGAAYILCIGDITFLQAPLRESRPHVLAPPV
jgi:MFS family permease